MSNEESTSAAPSVPEFVLPKEISLFCGAMCAARAAAAVEVALDEFCIVWVEVEA